MNEEEIRALNPDKIIPRNLDVPHLTIDDAWKHWQALCDIESELTETKIIDLENPYMERFTRTFG